MLIERIIRHPVEPTVQIDFDDATYVFAPLEAGGPLLAEVGNSDHIGRLLAITEGFRVPAVPAVPADQVSALQADNLTAKAKK